MYRIFYEEVQPYLLGQKSVEDVAKIIQGRLQLYLDEGDKCRCGKGQWPRGGKSGPEEEKVLDRINHFPYTGFIMQVNK